MVAAINRLLWRNEQADRDDLAPNAAQVLADLGPSEDLDGGEDLIVELQKRTRERPDLPEIAAATAQALFYAARDDSFTYDFVDDVQALARWLSPRLANDKIGPILTQAERAGLLDRQLNLGEAPVRALYEMWRAAMDAALDAEQDLSEDLQLIDLRGRLTRALDAAGDREWANNLRAALLTAHPLQT